MNPQQTALTLQTAGLFITAFWLLAVAAIYRDIPPVKWPATVCSLLFTMIALMTLTTVYSK